MITKNRSIFTLLFGFIIALSLALSFVFVSGATTAKASETTGGEDFYIYGASVRAQSEETNGEAAVRFHVLVSGEFYSAHNMGTDEQDVNFSVKFMAKDLLEDGKTVLTTAKTNKVRTEAINVSWWNSKCREGYKEAVAYYYGISSAYFDKDIAIAAIATTVDGDTIVTEQVSGSLAYVAYQADALTSGDTYKDYYSGKKYTVLWKNENGDTLETDAEVPYGTVPSYDGSTPTKNATAQYTYTFAGWDKEIVTVTGDVVYTAKFTPVLRNYTVSIAVGQNGYGTVNQAIVEEVPYGTVITAATNTIEVNGTVITATPAEKTNLWTYSFDSWTNGNATVNGDVTVTANFSRIESLASFLELTLKDEYKVDKTENEVHYDYEIDVSSNTFVVLWSSMDGGATKNHNFIKTDVSGMPFVYTVTKADGTAAEQHTIVRNNTTQRYAFFTYAADEFYTLTIKVINDEGADYKYVKINVDQSGNQSAVWFDMFEVSESAYNAYIHAAGGHTAGLTYSVGLENSRYGHERVLTLEDITSDAKILFGSESNNQTWFDGGKPQYYTLNITYYINSNGNKLTDYEIYNLIPKTYGSSWDCAGYTYETDKWITATYVYNKTVDGERVPLTHDTWVAMTDGKGIVLSNVTSYDGIEVYVSDISFGKTLPAYTPDVLLFVNIAEQFAVEGKEYKYEISEAVGKEVVLYYTNSSDNSRVDPFVANTDTIQGTIGYTVLGYTSEEAYANKTETNYAFAANNANYYRTVGTTQYRFFTTSSAYKFYIITININSTAVMEIRVNVDADKTCLLQTSHIGIDGDATKGFWWNNNSTVTATGENFGMGIVIKQTAIAGETPNALYGDTRSAINGKLTYNTVTIRMYIDSNGKTLTSAQIQELTLKPAGSNWTCSAYPTETDKWVDVTYTYTGTQTHATWALGGITFTNTTGDYDIAVYLGDISVSTVA